MSILLLVSASHVSQSCHGRGIGGALLASEYGGSVMRDLGDVGGKILAGVLLMALKGSSRPEVASMSGRESDQKASG